MIVISSVWEQDGRYSADIGQLVVRVSISSQVAKLIIDRAKKHKAIRKELPVRGGGYVWFFDKKSGATAFIDPEDIEETMIIYDELAQGSYDDRNIDSDPGGQGNGLSHIDH